MNLAALLSGPLPARAAAVAGGVAAAAITVLYLVRLRRRRVVVSFAPLWLDVAGPRRTTSWARRLRDLLSLLLALVLVGLVLLAAVDPRPAAADRAGRSLVVLIDRSASMSARDGASTRLDAARARAVAIVDGLAAADRALVASFAADAVAESGFEADAGRLRRAVAAVGPSEEPGDLPRALTFAAAILRGRPRPTVVLVSDGAFTEEALRTLPAGVDVRFAGVGQPGRAGGNVGIISFAARRVPADPSAVEAALVVQNFGGKRASVGVDIAAGDTTVERVRLDLGPGERRRHELPNVFAPDARLQARLLTADGRPLADGGEDDLALDDIGYAVVPPLPRRRVLRVGGPNLYLDGALLSLGRTVAIVRQSLSAAEAQRARWPDYDLVVFDSVAPASPPTAGRYLYLDAHGPGSPFAERGTVKEPVIADVRRDHPLAHQLDLSDVNISSARRLALAAGDVAVAGSFGVPLLIARERPGLRIAATSFDPRRSDLPMRPAFPLLIANALAWAPGLTADATLETPPALLTGASARLRDDLPEIAIAHVGFHHAGDMVVAANLGDVRESDTTPVRELELGGHRLAAPDPPVWRGGVRLSALALWLALALLLAECLSYHRRWTT
ncbi:MAG TPA: VWA domain-containing protein [Polyangia bacterium]|nr:VWA domain-containing protein [Polyangia bacterium]